MKREQLLNPSSQLTSSHQLPNLIRTLSRFPLPQLHSSEECTMSSSITAFDSTHFTWKLRLGIRVVCDIQHKFPTCCSLRNFYATRSDYILSSFFQPTHSSTDITEYHKVDMSTANNENCVVKRKRTRNEREVYSDEPPDAAHKICWRVTQISVRVSSDVYLSSLHLFGINLHFNSSCPNPLPPSSSQETPPPRRQGKFLTSPPGTQRMRI